MTRAAPTPFKCSWDFALVAQCGFGACRFNQLQERLGISRKVLAARLRMLVGQEILERTQYQERPDRYEYQLTEMGRDLLGVVTAMEEWSARWRV